MSQTLTITQPDDWHLHVRDGVALNAVVPATARCFARAIIMPNLKPPIRTVEEAEQYRQRILNALPNDTTFNPLMVLYLTDNTSPEEIQKLKDSEYVHAVKYYPAGATTNSDAGVTDLRNVWPVLEKMQELDVPLLIHGEVTASSVDIFDRERYFIEYVLDPILGDFPSLRVVLEHITTQEAVEYVTEMSHNLAATITAHHLLINRNAIFQGGINPHHYCLPILKREKHREALVRAATGGNPKFFLGTDSAPHPRHAKESACGCAGMYTAPAAIELYAEVFEAAGELTKLQGFASHHGADFYKLPRNEQTITLRKATWAMPDSFEFGDGTVIPFRAGGEISWQIV
ncbi:dihydroorotase [Candidatus Albibeggiatoa sp. nov. NOAA]|uniref:dihydroorotase n=1 Tax=Candidatus Albibeggiatoa sp. nov. NOAA TaxID=3162724 RepID=UPI003302A299|nr:dihydroorotase [Thiotrichaceae bacterium]